jgi:hypothetical protein
MSNAILRTIGVESINRIINLDAISFISDTEISALLRSVFLQLMNQYYDSTKAILNNNLDFFVKIMSCRDFNIQTENYEQEKHPFLDSLIINIEWQIIKSRSFETDLRPNERDIQDYYTMLRDKIKNVFDLNDNFENVSIFIEIEIKKYLKKQLTKKLVFGDLLKLIATDIDYTYEIARINDFLAEHSFHYKIEKFGGDIFLRHQQSRDIKSLAQLSYNEALFLTFLLTAREPWLMKTYYKINGRRSSSSINSLYNGDTQTKQVLIIDHFDLVLETCFPIFDEKFSTRPLDWIISWLKNKISKEIGIQVIFLESQRELNLNNPMELE